MVNEHLERAILANGDGEFWSDVAKHVQHGGHFYCGAQLVALWRPVWRHWPEAWLCDPARSDPAGDAWYVWACSGRLAQFAAMARSGVWPGKSWVAFHRRGGAREYALTKFLDLGKKTEQRTSPSGDEASERRGGSQRVREPQTTEAADGPHGGSKAAQV